MSRRTLLQASCITIVLAAAGPVWAQNPVIVPPPQNVLQLASSATVEVPQDWLSVTLSTRREGDDANAVQTQLKTALDAALVEARKAARAGQVEVRSGSFSIYPRYSPKGGVNGWQGTADMVIEGRDTAAVSQLAGRLQTLTVARTAFSLSREAREKVESEVAASAIGRFRAQAEAYAKQFGFAGYTIREVNVSLGNEMRVAPVLRSALAAAPAQMQDAALPVEAGRANVTATVNGSVQMSIR